MPKRFLAVLFVLLSAGRADAQFAYDLQSPLAAESFRTGVEAYGRGRYAEALAQFERALASEGADPLSLYWLGKAYFRLGLSGSAFERWNEALQLAGSSPFVSSRLELAGALADPVGFEEPTRYVRVSEMSGAKDRVTLFSRPSWIEPLSDGTSLVVSHGTGTVLVLDANARIVRTINGGSTGFDRPFACAVLDDGTVFLTEFQADRIVRLAPDGRVLGYSGDRSGPGRLSGPQYITADVDGFVYVTDVGFSRVVKYSRDGAMVSAFGTKAPGFSGLRLPTGIAAVGGRIYVADAALKAIFSFDSYGNYLSKLELPALVRPEGLRPSRDGRLLVADSSRVVLVDPESLSVTELYRSERRRPRLVSAAFDANGELLVADFDASEIAYLSDPATRFAGLAVTVERVYADSFPRVAMDVSVRDRFGRAMTGLGSANFYVSESVVIRERRVEGDKAVDYLSASIRPAGDFSFDGSLDASPTVDMTFLLEGSPELGARRQEARDAVASVYASLGGEASARMVVAGRTAQPPVGGSLGAISDTVLRAEASASWRFDTGLRLAAGSLFDAAGRRAVVYVGSGSINEASFGGASLSELSSLLEANDIRLYAVIVGDGAPSEALGYLVERSGGAAFRSDRPEGLGAIVASIRAGKTGLYRVSYTASADDGFGRSYLPFSVEAYLRDRSGKDESGYFAPLR